MNDIIRATTALLAALLIALLVAVTSPVAACDAVPVTPNTPTGIAGCDRTGDGIASRYGTSGDGVAMNFCTYARRVTEGCGWVTIQSHDTGVTVTVRVVDYCDCYTGTADERIVDLQPGVVAALGLDPSRGLYPVTVWREDASSSTLADVARAPMLPDTAMGAP